MEIIKCNCGREFGLERTYADQDGLYAMCPGCGAAIDTDQEVEMNESQADRVDEVYAAVYKLCTVLTENTNLEWDMSYIGEIADVAVSILASKGMKIRFPGVCTENDDSQYIEEYCELREAMAMNRAEYIVWKCETEEEIREQHPDWEDRRVNAYLRDVELKLNIAVKDEATEDLIRRSDVLNTLQQVFDEYKLMWDEKGGFAKAILEAIRSIPRRAAAEGGS